MNYKAYLIEAPENRAMKMTGVHSRHSPLVEWRKLLLWICL